MAKCTRHLLVGKPEVCKMQIFERRSSSSQAFTSAAPAQLAKTDRRLAVDAYELVGSCSTLRPATLRRQRACSAAGEAKFMLSTTRVFFYLSGRLHLLLQLLRDSRGTSCLPHGAGGRQRGPVTNHAALACGVAQASDELEPTTNPQGFSKNRQLRSRIPASFCVQRLEHPRILP